MTKIVVLSFTYSSCFGNLTESVSRFSSSWKDVNNAASAVDIVTTPIGIAIAAVIVDQLIIMTEVT